MLFFRSINKTVTLILLAFTVTVQAQSPKALVKCPSLETIHRAADKMKFAECEDGVCMVHSDKTSFFDRDQYWYLSIIKPIAATSEEEAISKVQTMMNNTSVMLTRFIVDVGFMRYCSYFDPTDDDEHSMASILALSLSEEEMKLVKQLSN